MQSLGIEHIICIFCLIYLFVHSVEIEHVICIFCLMHSVKIAARDLYILPNLCIYLLLMYA